MYGRDGFFFPSMGIFSINIHYFENKREEKNNKQKKVQFFLFFNTNKGLIPIKQRK